MALDTARDPVGRLKALVQRLGEATDAGRFAAILYAGTTIEAENDDDLAALAKDTREVLEFVADKPSQRHKIRIRPGHLPSTTLVEILNDDMPFLVDSVMAEIQARGLAVRFVAHPILKTARDGEGRLQRILGPADQNWADGRQESVIVVHLDALGSEAASDLGKTLSDVLGEVRVAVADWRSILKRVDGAIRDLDAVGAHVIPADLKAESLAFLRWMQSGHFVFLGYSEHRFDGKAEDGVLLPVGGSGLGLLRDPAAAVAVLGPGQVDGLSSEARAVFLDPVPLTITKSSLLSRVHRRVDMDFVAIKSFDPYGATPKVPTGEVRIVGLFTSAAYTQSTPQIPFLRQKIASVIQALGYPSQSHAGKALINVLDTFPRDELFQIGEPDLARWAEGVLDLELRPRARLFSRADRFGRFVSVLVYAPRDRWTTRVRERVGALLADAWGGRLAAFHPYFPDGPLMRAQFIVARGSGAVPDVDVGRLEQQVGQLLRTWDDDLADGLKASGELPQLGARYARAFPPAYSETIAPARAIEDMRRIERLAASDQPVAVDFYRGIGDAPHRVHAAIYRLGEPIRLSERVPVLENLGFSVIDERSFRVTPRLAAGERDVALHDMVLESADGSPIDLSVCDVRLEETFQAIHRQAAESDLFNRLVMTAGADWREAALIRAYASFLRQLSVPFGVRYIAETLVRHAGITRDLVELFHVRFDPDRRESSADARAVAEVPVKARVLSALSNVPSLDEDRILRQMLNLVEATLRTNFYQRQADGTAPYVIALKFDSKSIDAAPQPRPFREIWVYSPRVEAVHLRFAPIARGGIRWSDRAQDFRTEVLGLVKAQLVKNAVIVPSGAKGGFYPKQLPRSGNRDEVMKEGIAAYRIFISALLDITDNIVEGKLVAPKRVVRRDGDDPYLVVAADKGTATFSDFANEISDAHGHWLGDAFASGGSAGYDHKKMAITARGGWECVKRHFREMDIDIQTTPFTVTGVGDMSGDVFGNGMLLSPVIRLLAAFDHRDIFVDPNPDPVVGFAERKRVFALPRSSWQDYDKSKLSQGGGVFSRAAKSIPLSPEMRALFGLEGAACTPVELMRAVLKCKADLIWFGGIGTYVRASTESDEQAGDRANDAVRVTGRELGAKVVGEGANLALTQRGRMELAERGVRLNTDFIDNSAGVNSSDYEVNIKIALGEATRSGRLDPEARKMFLASMTADVAAACLRNNYSQSLAISLSERTALEDTADLARLMRDLERRRLLDRRLEALPNDTELSARQKGGKPLTRPELAVLLSYSKIALTDDLLASAVPDRPVAADLLAGYFPPRLRSDYGAEIARHRLRREIIATALTNAVINRAGPATPVRLAEESGRGTPEVALAFLAVVRIFDLEPLWHRLEALDGKIGGSLQLDLEREVRRLLVDQMARLLRTGDLSETFDATLGSARQGVEALRAALDTALTPESHAQRVQRTAALTTAGVPSDLSADLAALAILGEAPNIGRLAQETGRDVAAAAATFFGIGAALRLDGLRGKAQALPVTDPYDQMAVADAVGQVGAAQSAFARAALSAGVKAEDWLAANDGRLGSARATLMQIDMEPAISVSRLTVAAALLRGLTQGS